MDIGKIKINQTSKSNFLKSKSSKNYRPVPNAGVLDLVRDIVDPKYSLNNLIDLVIDAECVVENVPDRHIQASHKYIQKIYPDYSRLQLESRQHLLEVARKNKTPGLNHVGLLQLAAMYHAIAWYEAMHEIVPNSKLQQERFCEHFYQACWWTGIWQDLVKEHGDRVGAFLIFD